MNAKVEAHPNPPPAPVTSERTKNAKGSTFHIIGEAEQHWVSSLPESDLPLLDTGACYGVQTIHALNQGRDVIALDCCDEHITILRERVANMHRTETTGELVDAMVARLPSPDAIGDAAVSGILCSEVIHFMTPADLVPLLNDFHRWLAPGGRLVATVGSWPPRLPALLRRGLTLPHGVTADSAHEMLENAPAADVVAAGPGFLTLPDAPSMRAILGETLYMLSTQELRHVAEECGFVVDVVKYFSAGKYPFRKGEKGDGLEGVLLVASKEEPEGVEE